MGSCHTTVMHAVLDPDPRVGVAFSRSAGIVKTRALGVIGWFAGNRAESLAREASRAVNKALDRHLAGWRNDIPPGNEIIFAIIDAISKVAGRNPSFGGLGVFLHDSTEGRLYYSIIGDIGLALLNAEDFEIVSGGRPSGALPNPPEPGLAIPVSVAAIRPGVTVLGFTPGLWDLFSPQASDSELIRWLGGIRIEEGRFRFPPIGAKNGPDSPGVVILKECPGNGPLPGFRSDAGGELVRCLEDIQETADDIFSAVRLSLDGSAGNPEISGSFNEIRTRIGLVESALVHHDPATGEKTPLVAFIRNILSRLYAMEVNVAEIRESLGVPEKPPETAGEWGYPKAGKAGLGGKSSFFGMISAFASSLAELRAFLESKNSESRAAAGGIEYRPYEIDDRFDRILEILSRLELAEKNEKPAQLTDGPERAELTARQWLELASGIARDKGMDQPDIKSELKAFLNQLRMNVGKIENDRTININIGGRFFRVKSSTIKRKINTADLHDENFPEHTAFVELYFAISGNSLYKPDLLQNMFLKLNGYYADKATLQKFLFVMSIYLVSVLSIINFAFIVDRKTPLESGNTSYEVAVIDASNRAFRQETAASGGQRPYGETAVSEGRFPEPSEELMNLFGMMGVSAYDYEVDLKCLKEKIREAGNRDRTANETVVMNETGCGLEQGAITLKWKDWMASRQVSSARLGQLWLQLSVSPAEALLDGIAGTGTREGFIKKYGDNAGLMLDAVMARDWKA